MVGGRGAGGGGGVNSNAIGIKSPSDTPLYVPSQSVPFLSGQFGPKKSMFFNVV